MSDQSVRPGRAHRGSAPRVKTTGAVIARDDGKTTAQHCAAHSLHLAPEASWLSAGGAALALPVGKGRVAGRGLGVLGPVAARGVGVGLEVLPHHLQVAVAHKLREAL